MCTEKAVAQTTPAGRSCCIAHTMELISLINCAGVRGKTLIKPILKISKMIILTSFVGIFLGLGGNFAYGQKYWGYFTQIAFLAFFSSPHVAKKRYTYILLEARGILYSSLVFH